MYQSKQDLTTLKLRNTLYQLKQFTGRDHNRLHTEAPPIGITLISIQSYKNKRKVDKHAMQRSNRDNIENQLKLEIFKKIRETMSSNHRHSGLEVVRATMHMSGKSKPNSRARSKRLLQERNEEMSNLEQNVRDIDPTNHVLNITNRIRRLSVRGSSILIVVKTQKKERQKDGIQTAKRRIITSETRKCHQLYDKNE